MADRAPVMVATSAFEMGVDKPNLHGVIHVALPDSPDSYLHPRRLRGTPHSAGHSEPR
jgi:superfamily II DNA helicase RecQ